MQYKQKSNPEAEVGVLGTLIANGNPKSPNVKKAMLQLDSLFFYKPEYRELYQFIRKCFDSEQWFDIASVLGMDISQSMFQTVTKTIEGQLFTGNLLEHHVEELKRLYELRMQVQVLTKTLNDCMAEETPKIASEIVREGITEASSVAMNKLKDGSTFAEIYQQYKQGEFKNDLKIECGINQFGEVRNCGLITIAGDSGVGKTFFSIYVMNEIIKYQTEKKFLFFSLEMKRNDIWDRYLSIKLNKPIDMVTNDERAMQLPDGKVYDHPLIDIDYIETIAHLQSMEKPLSVIVVD